MVEEMDAAERTVDRLEIGQLDADAARLDLMPMD